MCTVTYIPTGTNGFILTQNRDESIMRPIASPPIKRMINGVQHIFPVDTQGMGTWIGASETGRAASLLNGGSKPHRHSPPYKHSRGQIIPDYFRYPSFMEFHNNYDFNGLEPFTLLIFEAGNIFETILNEEGIQYRTIDADKPFVYSSTTLYPAEARNRRRESFNDWFGAGIPIDQHQVIRYHKGSRFENEPPPVHPTGNHVLKTVSITSIVSERNKMKVDYYDLLNDMHFWSSLRLRMVA